MKIKEVDSIEILEDLFERSSVSPVLIFKHSTTCPISTDVYNGLSDVSGEVNVIVVQNSRPLSNEVAERTGVRHESPQAMVLVDRKPVYHASHYDVSSEEINRYLRNEDA